MVNAVVVSIRFILLVLCGQKQVTLENAAMRQQLAACSNVTFRGQN